MLAQRFQTTETVINIANGRGQDQALLAGELLVIPMGLSEPGDLPEFEILYLTRSQPLAEIARDFATTEEVLRRYNTLGTGAQLPIGRWLIVPLAGE